MKISNKIKKRKFIQEESEDRKKRREGGRGRRREREGGEGIKKISITKETKMLFHEGGVELRRG